MFVFLSMGLVFGLSAGFSPGPLLTLVISQTLRHGIKEGAKVAFAPLITDVPIILLSTLILSRLADYRIILGVVSLVGGLFVLFLAYDSLRTRGLSNELQGQEPQSLSKGVLVNLLSPHPYLFWLTVGGPIILKAWVKGPWGVMAFGAAFFGCLIGAKVLVAVLIGRSKQWLRGRTYGLILRALGGILLVFAFLLFVDGLTLLGVRW